MTPKLFTGLTVAAVGSLLLAAVVHGRADSWSPGGASGTKLLPTLSRDAEKIQTVTLKQGAQSLTIERKGQAWTLKDRGGYPVDGDRVRAMLLKLTAAELVDRKTRNPERFAVLELDDPATKDAKSRLLTVADDKGRPLAELIVGKRSAEQFGSGKGGTYVRRPNDKDTWLVNAEIDVPTAVNQWVDTTIFEAEIAKVQSVKVEIAQKPAFAINREAGKPANKDSYKLAGMPEGKKLKSDYTLEDIVNAFARVELEDVRKIPEAAPDHTAGQTAVFEAEGGLKITMAVRSQGEDRWAVVTATGDGDTKAAADKVNARAAGWEFKLPTWKADQIFKKQADLHD